MAGLPYIFTNVGNPEIDATQVNANFNYVLANATATAVASGADLSGLGVYNVKHYGAVGDGVTDDTAAIQNAITAAQAVHGVVYLPLPSASYLTLSTLTAASGVTFSCDRNTVIASAANPVLKITNLNSGSASILNAYTLIGINIHCTSTNQALLVDNTGNYKTATFEPSLILQNCYFTNVGGAATAQYLVRLIDVSYGRIIGCQLTGHNNGTIGDSNGISFEGCANFEISSCLLTYFNTAINLATSSDSKPAQGLFFGNTHVNGCVLGIQSNASEDCNFSQCMVDNSSSILNSTSDTGLRFSSCYFGSNQVTHAFVINQGGSGIFDSNSFVAYVAGNDIWHVTAPGSGTYYNNLTITGNAVRGSAPVNTIYWSNVVNSLVQGNQFSSTASGLTFNNTTPLAVAFSHVVGNIGYNPVGKLAAPAVPSSGVYQVNTFSVPVDVYISGGTITALDRRDTVGTGNVIQVSTTDTNTVVCHLEPGESIAITYSSAPTWIWVGY